MLQHLLDGRVGVGVGQGREFDGFGGIIGGVIGEIRFAEADRRIRFDEKLAFGRGVRREGPDLRVDAVVGIQTLGPV